MSDKTKFEGQLQFFAKASLWYYLPGTLMVTFLLGFLAFPDPLEFPVISVMFVVMVLVDIVVIKSLIEKRKNAKRNDK